jgi:S-adenosylmethionine-diacylglycerol 3-amino-3-carboxypropyl transferase
MFNWVHTNHLIYNTCWEDPRLDREALQLGPDDNVLVITSAGCNTLDYALCAPNHVYAVDMNPRQNALLELKIAAIRTLDFDTFFEMFGRGRIEGFDGLYRHRIRPALGTAARAYWDSRTRFFDPNKRRDNFYYHGTSGIFAWLLNQYLDRRPGLREMVDQILAAPSLAEQQAIYYGGLKEQFWSRPVRWAARRDATLAMVGVPKAQRQQVERHYAGGIQEFMEHCLEAVFAALPLGDNYFWRVYLTGGYTPECCPEYLKRDNFEALKGGLVDRISTHTETIEGFLRTNDVRISRFVLLDHMDWLSTNRRHLLQREWQAIVDRAAPECRVIWRSGGLEVDFVDPLRVQLGAGACRVGDLLRYDRALAARLHEQDRVHTYGSFHIADLATA